MRLYLQELKRILKSARARAVILLSIILPVCMAILANEFNDANYIDANGNTVSLHGTAALKYIEECGKKGNGEVTVIRLKNGLKEYVSRTYLPDLKSFLGI